MFEEMPKRCFKILSLDGGGVRGVMPLTLLREIELKTKRPVSDLFDLVAGTSTGGIVALLLSAQKNGKEPLCTADQARDFYLKHSSEIFSKSIFRSLCTGFGMWSPKYDRSHLDTILEQFFGSLQLKQSVCPVLTTSYSLTEDIIKLWTSWGDNNDALMSDIAGATSAAPTYFSPKKISLGQKETTLEVDGGIYANDPELLAVIEAMKKEKDLQPQEIFLLSLGTGTVKLKQGDQKLKNKGIWGWMTQVNLIDLMMNANHQSEVFQIGSLSLHKRLRVQIPLAQNLSSMDNPSPENLKSLIEITESVIESKKDQIDELCEFLLGSTSSDRANQEGRTTEIESLSTL